MLIDAQLDQHGQVGSAEVREREVPGEQVAEGRVVGHPLDDLARRPAAALLLAPLHGHPHALREVALHHVHEALRRELHVLGVRLHELGEQQLLLLPHAGRRPDELLLGRLQLVEQPLRSVHPHLHATKAKQSEMMMLPAFRIQKRGRVGLAHPVIMVVQY